MSEQKSITTQQSKDTSVALWILLVGNFIIGTGILLPAGLLNVISADFDVTSATAGQLMLVGGVVVAVGAPLIASLTSRIDRRMLLVGALVLYGGGHLLSAVAPSFELLLLLRAVTAIGAATFTPQAAATVGLLVTPEKRSAAIGFIFIGWSAAWVAGIPLGGLLASLFGWRLAFGVMGLACLAAATLVGLSLRSGLRATPLGFAAWQQALTSPVILVVLLVTAFSMSGQMTLFSYFAPIFRDAYQAGPEISSLAFLVAGVAGIVGNALAARAVGRLGVDRVIAIAIVGLIVGIGLFAIGFGSVPVALAGIMIWGLGSFSSNSMQQGRLVALAPPLAGATVALNTSVVYVGQAVGALVGGWYVDAGVTALMAWTACGFVTAALATSLAAERIGRR
jgi:MFS transporter, DHA1 family, inner membrane transport protein